MSIADVTDDALGRRALAGDRDAFAALFARHERGLFTVAHRLTGSAEDAADITQEAFLRVFARLDALEGREVNLAAYLHRTARNLVYDRSARRARELPVEDVALAAGPDTAAESDPELSALIGAQGADVRAANARLPERHRLALALREIEDMSYEDIGAVLDTTPGAVAALLVRARLALRRELRMEQVDTSAMDPGCRARLGDVGALIDGQLGADRAHVLSQHLELCPSCRAARQAFEQSRVLYRAWLPLPLIGLGAATAKAAESRGLVRFGDGGRGAGARARRGLRGGALVAAGSIGALVLFGAPTLVAIRSDSGPPAPLVAPAAAAPATTAGGGAATASPVTTAPPATSSGAVPPPPAAGGAPVAAPSGATAPGDPAEPPAIGPVVVPRRTRTSAPPPTTSAPPPASVAAPAAAPGTTSAAAPDPPAPAGTTTADPPPATTQPPPATTVPPPGGTTPPVSTDPPPGGVF